MAASAAAAAAHSRGGRVRLGCLDPKAKRFAKIEQPDKGDCVLFFHAVAKGGVDDGFDLLRFIRRLGDNGWMATAGITREQGTRALAESTVMQPYADDKKLVSDSSDDMKRAKGYSTCAHNTLRVPRVEL